MIYCLLVLVLYLSHFHISSSSSLVQPELHLHYSSFISCIQVGAFFVEEIRNISFISREAFLLNWNLNLRYLQEAILLSSAVSDSVYSLVELNFVFLFFLLRSPPPLLLPPWVTLGIVSIPPGPSQCSILNFYSKLIPTSRFMAWLGYILLT